MAALNIYNHEFRWTTNHFTKEKIAVLKQEFDQQGSEVVKRLQRMSENGEHSGKRCHDLYTILHENHSKDEVLVKFWTDIHAVPSWVDWNQIERGQRFFYRYALANLMGFGLQGFLGENAASAGTAEVLVRTGGFATRRLLRRLAGDVPISSASHGIAGSNSTRRLWPHYHVRNRILALAKQKPEYFDTAAFGQPVNDLDSIHSIATFCCNHSWLQLPFLGVHPSAKETEDYIALFRYIAYIIGAPHDVFATPVSAKVVMESVAFHEKQITSSSRIVGSNFVQCLIDLPPLNISASFIESGSRVLNGDDFCDCLGLGRPGWYSYACFRGFCWLVRFLAMLQNTIPALDDMLINYFRDSLHNAVIHSKSGLAGGTKFGFQYIPEISRRTGRESNDPLLKPAIFVLRPVEAFFFIVFVLGCFLLVSSPVVFGLLVRFLAETILQCHHGWQHAS